MNVRADQLSPRFTEAVSFAIDRHGTQPRKGSRVSYVSHLLSVAALVLEMEGSEDEAIAALLHDVIEDTTVDEAGVAERFGPEVAAIVRASSDTVEDQKPPWLGRKRAYIAEIAAKPPPALRISIADKLHNARSTLDEHHRIGDAVFDRFKNSDGAGAFESRREGTLWYYEALVEAFEARRDDLGAGGAAKLDDLARAVKELRARGSAGTVGRRGPGGGVEGETEKRGYEVSRAEEPWFNEGGRARPPKGFKIRGHDINTLLDELDEDSGERGGTGSSDTPPEAEATGPEEK